MCVCVCPCACASVGEYVLVLLPMHVFFTCLCFSARICKSESPSALEPLRAHVSAARFPSGFEEDD